MGKNYKIPFDEIQGNSPLDGTYKVSFELTVTRKDGLFIEDVVQSVATGFQDDPEALAKIAHIDLTKPSLEVQSKNLKAGDSVLLTSDVKLAVTVLNDDGYYMVGKETSTMSRVGDMEITLPEGSRAIVNQITKSGIELIEFDTAAVVPLMDEETDELINTQVNVELATFDPTVVEKVEE